MLYAATDRRVAAIDPAEASVRASFVPGDVPGVSEGMRVECVAASAARPARAFVGTFGAGLFRTLDGGASWERVRIDSASDDESASGEGASDEGASAGGASDESGLEGGASQVTAVAVAPWDPDVVFVGTEPSRVYRSVDGGESFHHLPGLVELPSSGEWAFPPRPETHHVRWLEPVPSKRGRVLVAVEAGALVVLDVEDGTASFRERPPGARRDTHSMATHPDAPGRVYAAAGDGYAESERHGDAWEHPQAGLDHRYCWSVAVDAADPDVRIVSAASGAYSAHSPGRAESFVYRKRGDDPWELATNGLGDSEGQTRPVLAAGDEAGAYFALSNRGLYRTTNAGENWTRIGLDADVTFGEGGGTASGLVHV